MLGKGVGRWSPARGHDYSVTEQRRRGAGWAVHYLGPGDRTGTLIGFGPTGPEAAEFAMADWEARGAPTQRMRANRLRRNHDEEGHLVFQAETRGGRYAIYAYERPDGTYSYRETTSGRGSGGGFGHSREGLRKSLAIHIHGARRIDGINYIIKTDELGVGELLSPNARTRHPRLRSTIDSPEVEEEVIELANYALGGLRGYDELRPFYEHGQWFVSAWDPYEEREISFSVVDTSSGLDLEEL